MEGVNFPWYASRGHYECLFSLNSPSFRFAPVFCVFKVFSMLTWYYCLLFISCAASVPVHNGKGIRLTPNEKIQPSRGRFHWFASPPLLSQPLSFCTFWFSPRVAQVGRSTLNPTSNSNIPFLILTLHYQSKFFFLLYRAKCKLIYIFGFRFRRGQVNRRSVCPDWAAHSSWEWGA